MLYVGFGVVCGLASGFSYNAVLGTVGAWFPDKQGLVSGILPASRAMQIKPVDAIREE